MYQLWNECKQDLTIDSGTKPSASPFDLPLLHKIIDNYFLIFEGKAFRLLCHAHWRSATKQDKGRELFLLLKANKYLRLKRVDLHEYGPILSVILNIAALFCAPALLSNKATPSIHHFTNKTQLSLCHHVLFCCCYCRIYQYVPRILDKWLQNSVTWTWPFSLWKICHGFFCSLKGFL